MSVDDISEYTFLGLSNRGKPLGPVKSLGYLVGLVDSPDHRIVDPFPAKRILVWLCDVEEQVKDASQLLARQENFFSRYFPHGFFPQTPVMLTKAWSPISAMLERGFNPAMLRREPEIRATASGIWEPGSITSSGTTPIKDCRTSEELFWAVLSEACDRGRKREMLISVIAKPGWLYESAIGSLPRWSSEEMAKSDRILWKRTPEG